MEYRLDHDMPRYFLQVGCDVYMGQSDPSSPLLICGEIYTANVMAPGACANYT